MRYPPQIYARAFADALERSGEKDEARIRRKFVSLLAKNGDLSGIEKVIEEIEKILVRRGGGRYIEIESARILPKKFEERLKKIFSSDDLVRARVRDELLAGVRILIDGEREYDFSFRARLRKMFS